MNDTEIRQNFNNVNSRIDNLTDDLNSFKSETGKNFDNVNLRIDNLTDDLNSFKTETRQNFDNVNSRIDNLSDDFNSFKTETRQNFEKVDQRFEQVDNQFSEIMEVLASIQRSVVLTEDYVTTRIPALFDAYSLNQDQHNNFNKELEHLDKLTEHHSIQISVLEDTSKIHSKQLENLA